MSTKNTSASVIATNKQAFRDYFVLETVECGVELRGSEVKALREAKVQIVDAFGQLSRGELWLHNLHISPYTFSQRHSGHDPLLRFLKKPGQAADALQAVRAMKAGGGAVGIIVLLGAGG